MIDVEPTVKTILAAAERMHEAGDHLNGIAKNMQEKNDLSYAAEAMTEIVNTMANLRLDLLVTRPIRALGGT